MQKLKKKRRNRIKCIKEDNFTEDTKTNIFVLIKWLGNFNNNNKICFLTYIKKLI